MQYPEPDLYHCSSGFSDDAVSKWLNDAYDEGLWDIDFSYNNDSVPLQYLMSYLNISTPGELSPYYWDQFGMYWNKDQEGAAAFYEKLLNDSKYAERVSLCRNEDIGLLDVSLTTFEDEFGDFEEYCSDPCGCGDTDEEQTSSSIEEDDNTLLYVGIAIAVLVMILIIVLLVVMFRKSRLKDEVYSDVKKEHVAHTSTASGFEEGTAGQTSK